MDSENSSNPILVIDSPESRMIKYAVIDIEAGINDLKIHDIGSIRYDGTAFHKNSKNELFDFISNVNYLCGHNVIHHDVRYLFGESYSGQWKLVDTLYLSPLLFPSKPYHRLVKDDKLVTDQVNNPVNDCKKALDLLNDEIAAWNLLPQNKKLIFASLLRNQMEFDGFLQLVRAEYPDCSISDLIRNQYSGKICNHADLDELIRSYPCGLAYALALIDTSENSITPGWVLYNFPETEYILKKLRFTKCKEGCEYCNEKLDVRKNLKSIFGFEKFRLFEGEPLQERAAEAAVMGKSLLVIFPTGGGKSLTFQLPALMASRSLRGLTVVISPLQSLMKDQVDNLLERGITDVVTINGMLDPITRALFIRRVQDGEASLLFISPEMLRSKTIQKILTGRNIVRFVIDEAHCFSSWGHDFRVDYLYIGKFIKELQTARKCKEPIAVSCFTATAKQKVIQDICDYFKSMLNIDLDLFATSATRTNLKYSVIHVESEFEKYGKLRELIAETDCPTIVYVSRTKRTKELADKLTRDGFMALPFNGKMLPDEKIANQESFMNNQVSVIVATSAFGMGVDKKDVGLVIHYDISDSLENYVQEAGRAGRDPNMNARCYVLYSDDDLDKHFILLNQTKLSISEIQQVWKAVREMTKQRSEVNCSALEIARKAGWDDSVFDIETRVKTALATLENSGFLVRGNNVPRLYATGILVKNVDEARKRICESLLFDKDETERAVRIIKLLISQKHTIKARNDEAESRVDYLADILGLNKKDVISIVERMRQEGILADSKDISAYMQDAYKSERITQGLLVRYAMVEKYIFDLISEGTVKMSIKQMNDEAVNRGIESSTEKILRTIINFLTMTGYVKKIEDGLHNIEIRLLANYEASFTRLGKRLEVCRFAIKWIYQLAFDTESKKRAVLFSEIELLNAVNSANIMSSSGVDSFTLEDVEEALLYLSKIGALKLEGGFLVLYNAMNIRRIKDSKNRFKIEDYRTLDEFYKLKIQQIHIVGEYANMMVRDHSAAQQYVLDYFRMDYRKFVAKYFKGERVHEIQRNITPQKHQQIFGQLSKRQREIISDSKSRCIVVAAGPGSGKTRVLVHKLASLLLLEDVKHEQLLMLTFTRAAATEFKFRLLELIGNAAHFVEIKTFHSYCFDLLGRIGNLEDSDKIITKAVEIIRNNEVEPNRISKTVLVIDEAQDIGPDEYALVKALMDANEDLRVIAAGDDDQAIYEFRGADSNYMYELAHDSMSVKIEMTENYRSDRHIVKYADSFLTNIRKRIKSEPIMSMSNENGRVEVTKHCSENMYDPKKINRFGVRIDSN